MGKGKNSSYLYDLSFAGATIVLWDITLDQFMDDANPVEISDLNVTNVAANCKGDLLRSAAPAPIMVSVTLIPNSVQEAKLYKKCKDFHLQGWKHPEIWDEQKISMKITLAGQGKPSYTFSLGTLVSFPPGPTSGGDGKLKGHTYTFAFTKID